MLDLTAPRVKSFLTSSNLKIGLDDVVFEKSNTLIARALEGHTTLTRPELKTILEKNGIVTDVRRLAHIIMRAELDGIICSGPLRGKQFTYALLEERVKRTVRLNRKKALEKLARAYFTSHGPAQLQDFAWWSGLTETEAGYALDRIRTGLKYILHKGRTYWFFPSAIPSVPDSPPALLLSIYDEYTIAYHDRSDISDAHDIERMISMGNALTAVIILNGKVAGSWKRALGNKTIRISLNPFHRLDRDEEEALEHEVTRYGNFFGIPAVLTGEP
jgi:hypothetical protein